MMFFAALVALLVVSTHAQRSCLPSVREAGEAVGKTISVNGVKSYVSYPPGGQKPTNAILFLTDIFGIPLLQQRLLADTMAEANYLVVMPDLFDGEAPTNLQSGFDFGSFVQKHNANVTDNIIAKTIQGMKRDMGIRWIGGVGYCWGGKYVPRFLAQGKGLHAGFIAHPSNLEDSEIEAITGPLSFAFADGDQGFPAARRESAASILQKKNATYETHLYSGVEHGFAVRTDVSIKQKRYAKSSAFGQAIRWFDVWIKEQEGGYPF